MRKRSTYRMKCCNNQCNQGRDCPLREEGGPLLVSFLQAMLLTACAWLLAVILVGVMA